MGDTTKQLILVVDDEKRIRVSMTMLLTAEGYEVTTAEHGFDALMKLRSTLPDIIISDLDMPQMSGFELLSVLRQRFPGIPVIAFSGAYDSSESVPSGVIADAFCPKGRSPVELLRTVARLIQGSASRPTAAPWQSAPVWIPRNGTDAKGLDFVVLTCTQCLRSFPLSIIKDRQQDVQETPCLFCDAPVRYIVDFAVNASSPLKARAAGEAAGAQ